MKVNDPNPHSIPRWLSQKGVDMSVDDKAGDFLLDPENLDMALDIVRRLEPIKVQLHRLFSSELLNCVVERLNRDGSIYSDFWEVHLYPEDVPESWAYLDIAPLVVGHTVQHNIAYVRLEQRGNFYFYLGVMAPNLGDSESSLEAINKLRTVLAKNGYKPHGNSPWWLGLRRFKPFVRDEDFLLTMAGDRDPFVRQFADNVWNLFADNEPLLREINRELTGKRN